MDQRPALLGRLRMADWIEMPEREFAAEIQTLETEPLFKKLFFEGGAIRRQRWPRGGMAGSFYEVNEALAAGSQRVQVEELLGDDGALVPLIVKLGREDFERYFLHADEPLSLAEIAKRTGLTSAEVDRIHGLLLTMGVQEEFQGLQSSAPVKGSTCLAQLDVSGGEPSFSFLTPHWARGLYSVRYEEIETAKKSLSGDERRQLPRLLKRIETLNLRQNTLYRILENAVSLQAEYLRTRETSKRRPISLRQLAHRLSLAPSTVSRALSGRSVRLPWGEERALITFTPGRRKVVRELVEGWLESGLDATDAELAEKLRLEHAIKVSRRTVNAVRHQLKSRAPKRPTR